MSTSVTAATKQIQIKSGVIKRLSKEHKLYIKEAEQQKQKLEKFIADGAEDWDINNGTRMMEEANRMITDSANRLEKAIGDLQDFITRIKEDPALAQEAQLKEEVLKAQGIIESA